MTACNDHSSPGCARRWRLCRTSQPTLVVLLNSLHQLVSQRLLPGPQMVELSSAIDTAPA
jgi:hypothetical protein